MYIKEFKKYQGKVKRNQSDIKIQEYGKISKIFKKLKIFKIFFVNLPKMVNEREGCKKRKDSKIIIKLDINF
jgi:hypothetical protein